MDAVKKLSVYKMEITDYLDMIMIWYSDVLIYKATKELTGRIFKDQLQIYQGACKKELL